MDVKQHIIFRSLLAACLPRFHVVVVVAAATVLPCLVTIHGESLGQALGRAASGLYLRQSHGKPCQRIGCPCTTLPMVCAGMWLAMYKYTCG